jgi:hypothetical protein
MMYGGGGGIGPCILELRMDKEVGGSLSWSGPCGNESISLSGSPVFEPVG